VTSQSFLKGLGKTFVHKSFPKSFFENHSMGQALIRACPDYIILNKDMAFRVILLE
jgi:hypothetical protein